MNPADLDPNNDCHAAAARLNRECACLSVDHERLRAFLEEGGGLDYAELRRTRPHLFSDSLVFAGAGCLRRMAAIVSAIETVVALPAYQERVLAGAPAIARRPTAARGVFLGYDFHLDPSGPRLIEINTNAGGGLLNARLAKAQRACCGPVGTLLPNAGDVEAAFVAMFREEWRLARGERPLTRIAIVDEHPGEQYLAPEFELFRQLFEAAGIAALVADPRELAWDGESLYCRGERVDLVYNRLTDFSLETPACAALLAACEADGVVLTPHPRAHALYADKRNLMLLSDPDELARLEVPMPLRSVLLAGIPRTVAVAAADGERFWKERRNWFFKPAAGFGSRAAYRGDKLTKRVFEEILQGGYIAQEIVPPSERRIAVGAEPQDMKLDLRCYVYAGQVQLVAARLYQGQTTNFRTPGGGFASVMEVPA